MEEGGGACGIVKMKKKSSRFPAARIKKIMRTDEDVGKVASVSPVLISRALELFLASLITATVDETKRKDAKKISSQHLKSVIENVEMFDFLADIGEKIPEMSAEVEKKTRGKGKKAMKEEDDEDDQ